MDKQLIQEKLESLRRCVQRLEQKCPKSLDVLLADIDAQDIITLNLTRAVQLCVDIAAHIISENAIAPPDTMAKSFDLLVKLHLIDAPLANSMKKSVGFRNIAVHDYEEINWAIVEKICQKHIVDFKNFAKTVSDSLLS